jgi:CubicO group peptidase (beta-lactamase class C family)
MSGKRVRKEYANWSKQFLIDALIKQEPQHLPGEIFHYSDPGYALLGIVIDNISGSYREFMENRIFKPLEMNSTYLVDQRTVHPFEARGYSLRQGNLVNIQRYHNIEIPSWFGVFSNITDLQKWDAALNSNLILDVKSKELLWQNYTLNNGELSGYGLGWFHIELGSYNFVQHGGITGTDWIKFPDNDFSVILLTNLGFNGADPVEMRGITNGIAQILGFNVAVNSDYITNSGLKVIPIDKDLEKKIIGDYNLSADWGNGTGKIYKNDQQFYLSLMGFTFEIGLLENGNLIQFGLPFEDILVPNENYSKLIFKDGAELTKQN